MNEVFEEGDILVLQVLEQSPLLKKPPPDFYKAVNRGVRSWFSGNGFDNYSHFGNSSKEGDVEADHGTKVGLEEPQGYV
jgi:hypothetical protein